jgi:hypothetical protein
MMLNTLVFAILLSAAAQEAPKKAPEQPAEASKVDPKLHADVLHLAEASGIKDAMVKMIPQLMKGADARLMQSCPGCDPEFGREWTKRMTARLNVDEFVAVYIRVYEKYLTDEDVLSLIELQKQTKDSSTPPAISPEFKEKLTSLMPSIQSEIMGGCTQIGAKLGGQIDLEIRKEHPEYFKK